MSCIQYEVLPFDPASHLFQIRCLIPKPDATGQRVSLPAWIPGSYLIRDFAKNITRIKASSAGRSVGLQPIDKDSWLCEPCSDSLLIEYQIYAGDDSVRAAKLDTTKAFFNGTSVFLRVQGQEEQSCKIKIHAPAGEGYADWRVATSMPRVSVDDRGFGEYQAENYDAAVDHPVAIGQFESADFEAGGVPHTIAFFGRQRADFNRLCNDLQRLCQHHIDFFQDETPFQNYLFIVMVVGEGYGGLEHRASSVLICSRDSLPAHNVQEVSEQYREFLGLCSHEYFHAWNVKRIRPAAFMSLDYQRETYTELLWAFEGITSYYDDLALLRCGLIDTNSYLQLLGRTITRVLRGKGRWRQTIAESSFYAWTKFYKQDENAANAIVSYYAKGSLIALILDLKLRQITQGQSSLDHIMRELWVRYGKAGKGITETTIGDLAEKLGGSEIKSLLNQALYTTEELPLENCLFGHGVSMQLRVAESWKDKGGKPSAAKKLPATELGAVLKEQAEGVRVVSVSAGSAAQQAGVWAGDIVVACNGLKASEKSIQSELMNSSPGDNLVLHGFRGDELHQFDITLQSPEQSTCYLEINPNADKGQQMARAAWFMTEAL